MSLWPSLGPEKQRDEQGTVIGGKSTDDSARPVEVRAGPTYEFAKELTWMETFERPKRIQDFIDVDPDAKVNRLQSLYRCFDHVKNENKRLDLPTRIKQCKKAVADCLYPQDFAEDRMVRSHIRLLADGPETLRSFVKELRGRDTSEYELSVVLLKLRRRSERLSMTRYRYEADLKRSGSDLDGRIQTLDACIAELMPMPPACPEIRGTQPPSGPPPTQPSPPPSSAA